MENKTQKPKLISKFFKQGIKDKDILSYPRVKLQLSPKIPPLKTLQDKTKINIRYGLIPPFSFAHIYWDSKISEIFYEVEEPILTSEENEHKEIIITAMKDMVDFNILIEKDKVKLIEYIDRTFKILAVELGINLSYESYKKIFYYLYRDFVGFNEIEPFLNDYFIEDIECNGVNTPLYIVHRLYRNLKTNIKFNDMESLASFVEKLAQKSGKYISYAKPILDGSLPDGSRVNATYTKDITSRGPTFTIRKFTKTPWTPVQLLDKRTLSPEILAYLWLLLEYKMSILIAGGTASGKTTLLNAMAFFIPPEARVVSIEDTRELSLPRENWLPSVVRGATGVENSGEVNLFTLLRASFRQNPDYVIVGEVRGREASVLFQGMASGHASIGTIHADSVDTVIKRLETPPIELSPSLLNVLDCICVMTHAIVKKQETRKLREIVEIINVAPDGITTTNTPFVWNAREDQFYFKKNSKIFEKISRRYGLTVREIEEEFRKRTQLVYLLLKSNIVEFNQVQEIINHYYKNPQAVLNRFNIR
ncbi:MAG: type II/IV secretion system ATPase subunit [Candidatus Pacearchaeota archaeon]|nr:type II/IV secretion system ATPase subunit [Candidatus Pacearchaeota archaeon]